MGQWKVDHLVARSVVAMAGLKAAQTGDWTAARLGAPRVAGTAATKGERWADRTANLLAGWWAWQWVAA